VRVEDTIPEGFELIEGQSSKKFGSIGAGMSVGMEYIVIPSAGNKQFMAAPARVQYTSSKQNVLKTLLSTTPHVQVLSTQQNLELYAVQVVRPHRRTSIV
jgi:Translocon-associated protein beta (TRAPB)